VDPGPPRPGNRPMVLGPPAFGRPSGTVSLAISTREMLQEARVRDLRSHLEGGAPAQLHLPQLPPDAIQRRLNHLDRVLLTDVDEARNLIRQFFGSVVLPPTPQGLVAELRGNIEGLLALTGEQALVVGNTGSGSWICIVSAVPAPFGSLGRVG
jgi:hypothetical protein